MTATDRIIARLRGRVLKTADLSAQAKDQEALSSFSAMTFAFAQAIRIVEEEAIRIVEEEAKRDGE